MPETGLHNINLNLLVALRALLQTGSVSRAADMIGRTPSSVSMSLSQLRELLKDPLFVRAGGGLHPTNRAQQLRGPVEKVCQEIAEVFQSPAFCAETSQRAFVIAGTDTLIADAAPKLLKTVRQKASHVSFKFVSLSDTTINDLISREIDFAILPDIVLEDTETQYLSRKSLGSVFFDGVLMEKTHPLASKAALTLEDIADVPQVSFYASDALLGRDFHHPLLNESAVVCVSQNLVAPHLLLGTDLIAVVVASSVTSDLRNEELICVPLSPRMEHSYSLVWSKSIESEEAHSWLRDQFYDT